MWSKAVIAVAGVLYLAMIGCALFPANASGGSSGGNLSGTVTKRTFNADDLPYRGVVLEVNRVDWIERYKESIDEIADLGADTVSLVLDARQENGASTSIYLDMRKTPTPEQLVSLIKHAKERKLRVVVMPIVLLDKPRGSEWRGKLDPTDPQAWFDSYRDIINHFAWVSELGGADVLVVGSELVTMQSKVDQWRKVIGEVRQRFKGRLTYSSNWDVYDQVPFWNELDMVGMNSYWKLGNNRDVTVTEIVSRWRSIQGNLLPWLEKQGKPLILLEAGWCSRTNAAHEPWDYTTADPVDQQLQRKLYEGFFRAWHGNTQMGGYMMWSWSVETPPPGDRGYSPKGKQAEKVLKEWLAKPWDAEIKAE